MSKYQIFQPHMIDGYKLGHISQYVDGTEVVYNNMTPRSDRLANAIVEVLRGRMLWFGMQRALKKGLAGWDETFFSKPKDEVIEFYTRRIKNYVGPDHGDDQIQAMADLWDIGYMPIEVKALPEGSWVNMGIPVFTVKNTIPDPTKRWRWLSNYWESFLSCETWFTSNAATVSAMYHNNARNWASVTGAPEEWVMIAHHCFAMRGHRGGEDAVGSGMGHLLFSYGTDTLGAIDGMELYYNADCEKEMIGCSVNAFEHATATQRIAHYRNVLGYDKFPLQAEVESLRDVCTNLYPRGIISYVADSEDYFGLLRDGLPLLREEILNREADALGFCKFVLRPDSSPKTPLEVIVGDNWYIDGDKPTDLDAANARKMGYDWIFTGTGDYYFIEEILGGGLSTTLTSAAFVPAEVMGSLELLSLAFQTSENEGGYKLLHEKVGIIYGEAITGEMQEDIYSEMEQRGWCVSNLLMGVGSWGFLKDSSRDSFGMALKGTHSIVDGEGVSMQKAPKTAMDFKKSARGLLRVEYEDGEFVLYEDQTPEQEQQGCLQTIFRDGEWVKETSLSEVRKLAMNF